MAMIRDLSQNKTGAPLGRRRSLREWLSLGAGVQHRDGAAVLRPARDVIAHRDRAFLAVGDGAHSVRVDAARGEEGADRLRPARAERDVVFAGAALIGVALDGEGIAVVLLQPVRLL